jgi:hypothetical protein
MPFNKIIHLVLRLFAIQWLVQGISSFILVLASFRGSWATGDLWAFTPFLSPSILIGLGILTWEFSVQLSKWLTRHDETPISISGLSREDIYCFAFVFVGLNFAMTHLGTTINWLHYFFLTTFSGMRGPERDDSLYTLVGNAVPLAAGIIALSSPRKWARKIIQRDEKVEQASSNQTSKP